MHPHHGFSVKKMLEMEVRASDLTLGKYVQTGGGACEGFLLYRLLFRAACRSPRVLKSPPYLSDLTRAHTNASLNSTLVAQIQLQECKWLPTSF